MNILFLMKKYDLGGTEVVSHVLANKFSEEGHNVSFFSFSKPNPNIRPYLNPSISVNHLDKIAINKETIETLRNILIRENINLIINQWGLPFAPTYIAKKASKGLNIKYISTYHNSPDSNARIKGIEISLENTNNYLIKKILQFKLGLYTLITRYSMRYVYKNSDIYILLSESYKDTFKRFTKLKSTEKLLVMTNPVTIDASDYIYKKDNKINEIIYVGRIDYNQKRTHRLIDIWENVSAKHPNWKLTIIGDGPNKKDLVELSNKKDLQNITFTGFKDPIVYYKQASILLLVSEYEGFPLVIAEAMSYGVIPIVYGSYSSVYDIIKDSYNGQILKKEKDFDTYQMSKLISQLITDQEYRHNIALNAISTSNDYEIEPIYQKWKIVFEKISIKKYYGQ